MSGAIAPTKPLTALDVCDRCGAQAYVRVLLANAGELLFCAHHGREHAQAQHSPERGLADEQAGERAGGVHLCVGQEPDRLQLGVAQQVSLVHDQQREPAALAVRRFVRWSITSDASQIDVLGYVPLPRSVTEALEGILSK